MRTALVLLAAALLAAVVPAPASSATKYKPCTLLTTADLEGALKAKVTRSLGENEVIDDEEPLKGEAIDACSWVLGSASIGVVLRITRAIAPVPQMAAAFFTPLEETARKEGAIVEVVKVAGAECHIWRGVKVGPVRNSTLCLIASKGLALLIEVNTAAPAPVPAAVAQGLLGKAAARLP